LKFDTNPVARTVARRSGSGRPRQSEQPDAENDSHETIHSTFIDFQMPRTNSTQLVGIGGVGAPADVWRKNGGLGCRDTW